MKGKSYVMILLINGRRVRRVLGDINEEETNNTTITDEPLSLQGVLVAEKISCKRT